MSIDPNKETKYWRSGKTVMSAENFQQKSFGSVNAAKRFSRQVQMDEDGALGRGTVKVVNKLSNPKRKKESK